MDRYALTIILAVIFSATFAQEWEKVDQSAYGMKYELPKGWEIDGFGWSNDWETTGSAVCDCSGTINIGNYWSEEELYMVVYPTRHKDSLDALKRHMVWDMTFVATSGQDILTTAHGQFMRKIGKWEDPGTVRNYEGNIVWQLKTRKYDQYYMLYFWGKPEVWAKNENVVARILNSFRPVRAK